MLDKRNTENMAKMEEEKAKMEEEKKQQLIKKRTIE